MTIFPNDNFLFKTLHILHIENIDTQKNSLQALLAGLHAKHPNELANIGNSHEGYLHRFFCLGDGPGT